MKTPSTNTHTVVCSSRQNSERETEKEWSTHKCIWQVNPMHPIYIYKDMSNVYSYSDFILVMIANKIETLLYNICAIFRIDNIIDKSFYSLFL